MEWYAILALLWPARHHVATSFLTSAMPVNVCVCLIISKLRERDIHEHAPETVCRSDTLGSSPCSSRLPSWIWGTGPGTRKGGKGKGDEGKGTRLHTGTSFSQFQPWGGPSDILALSVFLLVRP